MFSAILEKIVIAIVDTTILVRLGIVTSSGNIEIRTGKSQDVVFVSGHERTSIKTLREAIHAALITSESIFSGLSNTIEESEVSLVSEMNSLRSDTIQRFNQLHAHVNESQLSLELSISLLAESANPDQDELESKLKQDMNDIDANMRIWAESRISGVESLASDGIDAVADMLIASFSQQTISLNTVISSLDSLRDDFDELNIAYGEASVQQSLQETNIQSLTKQFQQEINRTRIVEDSIHATANIANDVAHQALGKFSNYYTRAQVDDAISTTLSNIETWAKEVFFTRTLSDQRYYTKVTGCIYLFIYFLKK